MLKTILDNQLSLLFNAKIEIKLSEGGRVGIQIKVAKYSTLSIFYFLYKSERQPEMSQDFLDKWLVG